MRPRDYRYYSHTPLDKAKYQASVEAQGVKANKIGTMIIGWLIIPLCFLCLAFEWWLALFILGVVGTISWLILIASSQLYVVGVLEGWWDPV